MISISSRHHLPGRGIRDPDLGELPVRRAGLAALTLILLCAAAPPPMASAAAGPAAIAEPVIDLHDGMILKSAGTWYLYGTMYRCGFTWGNPNTPFCGFGVATSSSPGGPWSTPTLLFDQSAIDPYSGLTWSKTCGGSAAGGGGCFNPRMIQRSGWGVNDGQWLLWFNMPFNPSNNGHSAYHVMRCAGPAGPCGHDHAPLLHQCKVNGDFSIVPSHHGNAWIFCSTSGGRRALLSEEELTPWGINGTGTGRSNGVLLPQKAPRGLAGVTTAEGVGAYHAPRGLWVMTFSDPQCGYCAGTGDGYATARHIGGPWTFRGMVSAKSCNGQPRTDVSISGREYQEIDLWDNGNHNEALGRLLYVPLVWTSSGLSLWTC